MIIVQTRFYDHPSRLQLRGAHRELLQELVDEGVLLAGGPFEDGSGAMLLFDTDLERVQRVIDHDPYMSCEGVEVVGVHEWNLVAGSVGPSTSGQPPH